MRVTVLVDNYVNSIKCLTHGLYAEWGFAIYIHDLRVLYDTGLTGDVLLHNMQALGIGPDEPDVLILSHRHIDHTGGVKRLLRARKRPIRVVAHKGLFEKAFAKIGEEVREIGVDFTPDFIGEKGELRLIRGPLEIQNGVFVSGEIPRKWGPSHVGGLLDEVMDDMALYIRHEKGLIIITGCGHSGIENIVEYGLEVTGAKTVYAVIGGLHLVGSGERRVHQVCKYLESKGVRLVMPCHCTGFLEIALMRQILGDKVVLGGVGTSIGL